MSISAWKENRILYDKVNITICMDIYFLKEAARYFNGEEMVTEQLDIKNWVLEKTLYTFQKWFEICHRPKHLSQDYNTFKRKHW